MADSVRCNLCDLPRSQCVHGLRKTKPAKSKKRSSARATTNARAPKAGTAGKCSTCKKNARYERYSVCAKCLVRDGGKVCRICGRLLRPEPEHMHKKPKCKTCRHGNWRGKDVYVVAQAGSPGLGKRA